MKKQKSQVKISQKNTIADARRAKEIVKAISTAVDGIAGNALVVCSNADGDFTDCDLPAKLFADNIRFLDLTKEPLPEPRQFFVPIEGDFTEENIEKARLIATFLMSR